MVRDLVGNSLKGLARDPGEEEVQGGVAGVYLVGRVGDGMKVDLVYDLSAEPRGVVQPALRCTYA